MAEAFGEELYGLWSNIPSEILSLIRSYITREKDYNILRFVCKSWRCIFVLHRQSPLLSIDHFKLRSPLLTSLEGNRYNFFHPLHHTYYMNIPELSNKRIVYSKDGWLLVKGGSTRENKIIFFFNPFTNTRIDLPDIPFYHAFVKFSFSGIPTSNDYVVVGFESGSLGMNIGVIKFGEEDWQVDEINFEEHCFERFDITSNPVFVDGYCYCLDIDGKVGKFDPDDAKSSWEVVANQLWRQGSPFSLFQSFMVESDGELLTIFLTNDGRVSVYKLYWSNMKWIEVEDLDDKVIYVSNAASWVERGISKKRGTSSKNKIYFPLLYDDKALVFYNLGTRRYHSNGYDFSRNNFYGMKYLPHSSWIQIM